MSKGETTMNMKKSLSLLLALTLVLSLGSISAFAADDTVKIGAIGPTTGGAAIYG
jgi:ABC-type sugar transport system substrate-binding protein